MKNKIAIVLVFFLLPALLFGQSASGGRRRGPSTYQLTVNANVKSYQIFIDGRLIKGRSIDVKPGTHNVTVKAKGYVDWQETVEVDGNKTIRANLQPVQYRLTVNANVNRYDVFIDGKAIKGKALTVEPGQYTVKVSANDYYDWQQTVNVNNNQTITAKLELIEYSLTVDSNVGGASVYIDGNSSGSTQLSTKLKPGTYNIRVSEYGYKDYSTTVNLNKNSEVYANLEPNYAQLKVNLSDVLNNDDKGASKKVEIYVDGKKQNGINFQVVPGEHTIQIVSGGFSIQKSYSFDPGKNYTITTSVDLSIQ